METTYLQDLSKFFSLNPATWIEGLSTPVQFAFQTLQGLFTEGHQRVYWPYLLSAVALAYALYLYRKESPEAQEAKEPHFLAYLFPKAIYGHRSAVSDYIYTLVNAVILTLLFSTVLHGISGVIAGFVEDTLSQSPFPLDFARFSATPIWIGLYTLVLLLAFDLGIYLAHYLEHRIPLFWEFHKTHHTAEVLTPFTVYRQHPMDDLLAFSFTSTLMGMVQGVFQFFTLGALLPWQVFGINVGLVLFYFLGYNLRHSHIWVDYGPFWSRIFISPAQHQIHHSVKKDHHDRNFGFLFAFWDRWMGTLYVPTHQEALIYGIDTPDQQDFKTAWDLYWQPFRHVFNLIKTTPKALFGRGWTPLYTALTLLCLVSTVYLGSQKTFDPKPYDPKSLHSNNPTSATPSTPQDQTTHSSKPQPSLASLYLEDLTWPEVDQALQAGYTTVIIPTGGTEQNGHHMTLGKHNHIVSFTSGEIAKRLGHTLIAPVIAYVPEGRVQDPGSHMQFAGTLSLRPSTFEAVLIETAESLKQHGFKTICLVGDSGGNQNSQNKVAQHLNAQWQGTGVQVITVFHYYSNNHQIQWLLKQGFTMEAIGTHAGIRDTSELLAVNPSQVRSSQLTPTYRPTRSQEGSDGMPNQASESLGNSLLALKIQAAVDQIQASRQHPTPSP